MKIVLQHLTKKFPARGPVRGRKNREDVIAVNDFDFEIPDGKLIGLLGPSGCGKSTALNLICGLLKPTEGKIFFGEDDVTGLPPENRGVGMVFQNYAIFPNLSVRDNVAFGLKNRKVDKAEIKKRTDEFLNLMQIMQYADRMPNQLSGGQQQRIALARALVISPDVLLMDEPTSALDPISTSKIEELAMELKEQYTIVIVTHNMQQAARISDRTAFFYMGRLVESDSTDVIFTRPSQKETEDYITGRFG